MSNVGTIEVIASIDTSRYKKGARDIESTNKDIEGSGEQSANKVNSGFSKLAKVGLAAAAAAVAVVGVAITKNIGNAVKRIDTLDNSARTFENMGFAAGNVKKSMTALEKSITGLPTPLDSAVRGMTSLAATYGDIDKGQKIFTALNNAILGFGGSAAEVDNAINQLSQLPMDGPLDAQTWNSLRNSGLTPVLVAMSKDMGISINEMKEKFGEGELTVKDFTDALIKMNKDGGGGMKSLEKIAKDSTSGIATGWANMQTAITKGIGVILKEIGSKNIATTIGSIGEAFKVSLEKISEVIRFLKPSLTELGGNFSKLWNESIKPLIPVIGTMLVGAIMATVAALNFLLPIINNFSPVLVGFATAFIAVKTAMGIAALVTSVTTAVKGLSVAMAFLAANPIMLAIGALALIAGALFASELKTTSLKAANDRLKQSYLDVKNAMQQLKDAQIAKEQSDLIVEAAQKRLNEATRQYGPKSYEARQAAIELKSAINEQGKAAENTKTKHADLRNELGKENEAKVARFNIQENQKRFKTFGNQINETTGQVQFFNSEIGRIPSKKIVTVEANFIGPLQENQIRKLPGRALGGPVSMGQTYMVGERGRELFVPETDGVIIPNNVTEAMRGEQTGRPVSGGGGSNGKNITINMDGVMARSRADLRDIGKDIVRAINEELQSKSQPLIGEGNI